MINKINLSSRPYRNRTLPWLASAFLLVVAFLFALPVLSEWNSVSARVELAKKDIAAIEPQIAAKTKEGQQIKEALTPEQKLSLISAHTLVDRKRFSWSRLFADLESVLPNNVSVSRVNVRDVFPRDNRISADLDFAVMSRDSQLVIEMLNQMNASGKFQAELRGQDLQRDKGNLSEYTIQLRYSPGYGVADERGGTPAQTSAEITQ